MSTTTSAQGLAPPLDDDDDDDESDSSSYCDCCNPAVSFTYELKARPSRLKNASRNEKAYAHLHDHCLVCPHVRSKLGSTKVAMLPHVTICEHNCCANGCCDAGACCQGECCQLGCCIAEGHDLCRHDQVALRSWTWREDDPRALSPKTSAKQSTLDDWLLASLMPLVHFEVPHIRSSCH
jgi:hypothetical protein